jgi:hypothetical protein
MSAAKKKHHHALCRKIVAFGIKWSVMKMRHPKIAARFDFFLDSRVVPMFENVVYHHRRHCTL